MEQRRRVEEFAPWSRNLDSECWTVEVDCDRSLWIVKLQVKRLGN